MRRILCSAVTVKVGIALHRRQLMRVQEIGASWSHRIGASRLLVMLHRREIGEGIHAGSRRLTSLVLQRGHPRATDPAAARADYGRRRHGLLLRLNDSAVR